MSNLLDKASILLTPTAYDNGRMLSVKPNENLYGSELVTNGDFATDSDWTKGTGWTIANGKASQSGGNATLQQSGILTANKTYKLVFEITEITSGSVRCYFGGNYSTYRSSTGTYTEYITNGSTSTFFIQGNVSFAGSIDNVSVVEDLSGDFQFSRSSAATRVNAQGLVENVQIISSELVSNGNFSQIGTEEVLNGNFSQEGSELIVNGDFSDSSWWGLDASWTISGGSANCNGSGVMYKGGVLTIGKTYKVEVEVSAYTSGSLNYPNASNYSIPTSIGKHTFYYTAASQTVSFTGNSFIGSIDNVSVKEVGQDWNLGNKWSIGENSAIRVPNSTSNLSQVISGISGKTIKVSYEVSNYVAGDIGASADGNNYNANNGNGTFVEYITPTSDNFYLRASYSFEGSITNISVKEVGQDWSNFNGCEIGENKVIYDGTLPTADCRNVFIAPSNKNYKVTYTVEDYVQGTHKVRISNYTSDETGNGTFTDIINSGSGGVVRLYGTSNFIGSFTNISVKEITDDTDLPRINYEGFSYQDSLGSEEVVNGDFATDSNWNKDDSWTISGGTANYNYISGRNMNSASAALVVGKTYKLVYTILNYSSGYVINDSAETRPQRNSNGTYTEVFTARYTFFRLRGSVSGEFSIDNVSVKEVLGQEVVPDSGCGSWLLEPQSTNLITYSEDFSQWNNYITTPTLNSATSPSGDVNSAKLTSTGVFGSLNLTISKSSSALNYTQSVFIKGVNYSIVNLISYGSSSANRAQVSFDLSDGSVSSAASVNGVYSNPSESIEDYGNGWYRISLSFTSDTSVEVRPHIQFPVQMTSDDYVLLWGAQLEEQSYATSYIPTNGATNTRLQDIATNSGNSSLINSTEGVFYCEAATLVDPTGIMVIGLSDGTLANRISITFHSTLNLSLIHI